MLYSRLTIDTLIFALVINVMEVAQDLDRGEMTASVIDDALAAVLDQVLEQL